MGRLTSIDQRILKLPLECTDLIPDLQAPQVRYLTNGRRGRDGEIDLKEIEVQMVQDQTMVFCVDWRYALGTWKPRISASANRNETFE